MSTDPREFEHPIDGTGGNVLDEIQARADAATEGPWLARDCKPCTERGRLEVNIYDHTGNFQITTWCDDDEFHRPDAEFIAHAREDVPKLVAALRSIEDLLAYWDTLADGDRYYAATVRARIREALG